jgi:hypothetical protein
MAGSKMPQKKNAPMINPRENNDNNHFIYAQPESSDEDRDHSPAKSAPTSSQTRKRKAPEAPPKRAATTAASSRSKRLKLQDDTSQGLLAPPENPVFDDPFGLLSSGSQASSQKKKNQKVYGRKIQDSGPVLGQLSPRPKKSTFKLPGEVELPDKRPPKTKFQRVADVPDLQVTKRQAPEQRSSLIDSASPEAAAKPAKSELQGLDPSDFTSSNGTEGPGTSDIFEAPEKQDRQRSSSLSPLSSVNEMYLLAHGDDYKYEDEPRSRETLCPVCRKPVRDSADLFIPDNLRTLPYRQQKKFCSQHRIAEARKQWKAKAYPAISWEELGDARVSKQLPHLESVISRRTKSFYLDQLDSAVEAARGNRRKVQRYLNEDLINIAKIGYYGPKGSRIMVNALAERLSDALTEALKSDSAVRAVGAGNYVGAVLMPELAVQLVMEDMKLCSSEKGRKVLDESTEIGELLNPDDDEVRREEDEDD